MSMTRRDLLKTGMKAGMGAATLAIVPQPLLARLGGVIPEPVPPIQDTRVKALALRAVEAARAAGAAYADVRLTHTRSRFFRGGGILDAEQVVGSVRALVDGYWGFAASPVWSPDEMARLGREAVHQAGVMAIGPTRDVLLASAPAVDDEHWTMPVEIDPFEVSPFEITDHLASLRYFVDGRFSDFNTGMPDFECHVQERAFASSEGSYCTQRLYRAEGGVRIRLLDNGRPVLRGAIDVLTPAGVGWELYKGQPIREHIHKLMEEMKEYWKLPAKPVDVGRYDVACDARTVARLVDLTLGRATELDRALGYEANAGGTSYLNDPSSMLGSYEAGAPILTLTADRSQRGGAATVRWDDESVRPDDFTIVKDGVLRDFQTTRESAGWLAEAYAAAGRPVRSHGCAAAPSALEAPLHHTPNLMVAPGAEALDFDGAMEGLKDGLAIKNLSVELDFQALNGLGSGGWVYEVKDGAPVARIAGAGFLFRAPELWKRLVALGGEASLRRYGTSASKGEPAQRTYHSVTAPPAVFEELTVIDAKRKA